MTLHRMSMCIYGGYYCLSSKVNSYHQKMGQTNLESNDVLLSLLIIYNITHPSIFYSLKDECKTLFALYAIKAKS